MNIAMTKDETTLLKAFLSASSNYLEFGTGGSTFLAAQYVKSKIITIDSSQEWLDSVEAKIETLQSHPQIVFHQVDIGKTGQWGYPTDTANKSQWPDYSESVWSEQHASKSDLYLVDGRFRIACFAETAIRAQMGAIILIHDFANRPKYHVVSNFIRCIAVAENLSAFIKDNSTDVHRAAELASEYRLDPE